MLLPLAGIVSTTGATATDALFETTASAAITTAIPPVMRKRIRSHGHRRLQDTVATDSEVDIPAASIMSVDNSTDAMGPAITSEMDTMNATTSLDASGDNTTFVDATIANSAIISEMETNTTYSTGATIANVNITEYEEEDNAPIIPLSTVPGMDLSTDFDIEPSTPVQFNVCPGIFDFETLLDKDPLVIEALTHNPVWIRCASTDDTKCVFSGGHHHLVFNNHGAASKNGNSTEETILHPLTISGITFQKALSAVSMYDPRGEIIFDRCEFNNNQGAAVIVNGRYEGTHTAYYDYDDDLIVDGGGVDTNGGDGPIIDVGQDDDVLQEFYEDVITPAPITANPSPAPNTEPTTEAPVTPIPTTALRILPMPTVSPAPSLSINKLIPIPERGGYTGPPTLPDEGPETDPTEGSFLLPATTVSGSTVFVDPSTTWSGNLDSTTTTISTTFSTTTEEDDAFSSGGGGDDGFAYDDAIKRNLDSTQDNSRYLEVDNLPKAIITMKSCHFHGNTGSATILMTSHHGEMETQDAGVLSQTDDIFREAASVRADVPMAHSIHMTVENSVFDSERVKRSVIVNKGGRLQTSESKFVKNAADSIIHVESGTIAMSETEFADNVITGDSGLVEYDDDSTLELNENNCDSSSASESAEFEDAPVSLRLLQNEVPPTCNGIYSDGLCRQFDDTCVVENKPGDNELISSEQIIEGCVSTWDELVTAVRESIDDERDFIICPQSTLDIDSSTAQAPVVIDKEYITIKCGNSGSLSDECAIVGGQTQFHVTGSATGVELAGLRMLSSRGSSVVAAGAKGATLHLKNCEWMSNVGQCSILIHSDAVNEVELDIQKLMNTTNGSAMSVEINDCIFRKNAALFGTIGNIGGFVSVYKTLLDENFAMAGDIVSTNGGDNKMSESCFDASSSTAPGTIFIEYGSSMSVNTNNFGINSTSISSECNSIFQELQGSSCLDSPAMCEGSCIEFTSTKCDLPMYDKFVYGPVSSEPVVSGQTEENAPPHSLDKAPEPVSSNNLIPIIVATLVSAFIIFGLAGIIWHRKRKGQKNGGTGGFRSKFGNPLNPLAKLKRNRLSQAQAGELNDAYDELDRDDNEEDMH